MTGAQFEKNAQGGRIRSDLFPQERYTLGDLNPQLQFQRVVSFPFTP